ncbi:MAG: MarR family transcriptional regulator [Desulfovibrionales bacterium]|nr:MarR family transcriptional regulator [Desulfovibrionales bacterium]
MDYYEESQVPLGYAVAMTSRLQSAIVKEHVQDLGITYAQVPFLAELFRQREPITQDMLSKALCIDPAATARALEHLQKKGLIRRKVNPKNRRQKLVSVTEKANWMKSDFRAALRNATMEVLEPLTRDEQEELGRLLSKVCLKAMTP